MLKNLKTLRQQKGVSQQLLADFVLVSQQSINKYENHNVEPDIATLIRIADYFNVSVDYLIGRTDVKHSAEKLKYNDLNVTESKMINKFRYLNENQKECIVNLIDSYE